MNTIFDFKRAGLLIQRHFIEKFQGELMFWGVSIICLMFIRNTMPALVCFAIITCTIRTGKFFKEIHSPTNRINYFMIPATQIEKFVVSLLYAIVFFWLMMFASYSIGNILGTWINNLLSNFGLLSGIFGFHYRNIEWTVFNSISLDNVIYIVIAILIVQSIFLLGSVYFKNNQFLKTCLALIAISICLSFISAVETKIFLFDNINMTSPIPLLKVGLSENGLIHALKISIQIFYYLLVPYLWLTSYIRLTEKEV